MSEKRLFIMGEEKEEIFSTIESRIKARKGERVKEICVNVLNSLTDLDISLRRSLMEQFIEDYLAKNGFGKENL